MSELGCLQQVKNTGDKATFCDQYGSIDIRNHSIIPPSDMI
jgi:hypothetical protein